ncbi:MAG: glucosamine-6-phosphate deaminase [Negativicutes bacterium]|nr:glucosamine-6-phosphate deaminase [Negativicutes bacterium]
MQIISCQDYDQVSLQTWQIVERQIKAKPATVLSLTTGATPRGFYRLFADAVNAGLDISQLTIFNLDEYVLPAGSPLSVAAYMQEHFYGKISCQPARALIMDGSAADLGKECERYRQLLAAYPRDIQILGLGTNGHIGANEPGTPLDSTVFCADLAQSTIDGSRAFFGIDDGDRLPRQMLTMGISEIMAAETVILFASGVSKAGALRDAVRGEVTSRCPASVLQRHRQAIIIADQAALSLL